MFSPEVGASRDGVYRSRVYIENRPPRDSRFDEASALLRELVVPNE